MNKTFKDYLFVGIQFLLFVLYVFDFNVRFTTEKLIHYVALLVSVFGLVLMLLAVLQLKYNLTIFPTPKSNGSLVTNGIYRFSRHPIYSGILFLFFGYSIFIGSWYKLVISLALLVLFYFKSRYEEQQLQRKFSSYKTYRKNVGRFFPK